MLTVEETVPALLYLHLALLQIVIIHQLAQCYRTCIVALLLSEKSVSVEAHQNQLRDVTRLIRSELLEKKLLAIVLWSTRYTE